MFNYLKYIFLPFTLCFIVLFSAKAQENTFSKEEVKAAYIFSFGKYVTWKNENQIRKFVVGVLGSDEDYQLLLTVSSGTKLKDASIGIAHFESIKDIKYTHVLYVTAKYCDKLTEINKTINKNTLVVSDNCPDENKIMINFLDNDPDKRKFELNIKNILFADLEISRKIVTLGGGDEANWQDLFISTDAQLADAVIRVKEQMEKIAQQQADIDTKTEILTKQEGEIKIQQDSIIKQKDDIRKRQSVLDLLNVGIEEQTRIMDEKQKETDELNSTLRRKDIILYLAGLIIFIIVVFAYFVWRSYKIKKKVNKQLQEKNIEITQQNVEITKQKEEIESQHDEIEKQRDILILKNEEIEQKNEEIIAQAECLEDANQRLEHTNQIMTSSIQYAKKIQDAILPSKKIFKHAFPNSFIYFKPRDIVSGDFYWFAERNGIEFFAVVDCTGHGVPGAFMSMIGNTLLNELVEKNLVSPAVFLDKMNERVISTLKQGQVGEDSQDDGMDMTLCVYDSKTNILQLACANHMAYLIKNNKLEIIDGDIFSVGDPLAKIREVKYTNNVVKINEGDSLYIFSDGFQDQFGGIDGRKFMAGKMQKLLLENNRLNMDDQRRILDDAFIQWKGDCRQLDDVLVIGIKF